MTSIPDCRRQRPATAASAQGQIPISKSPVEW